LTGGVATGNTTVAAADISKRCLRDVALERDNFFLGSPVQRKIFVEDF
jgi:hypothetical protein